MRLMHHILKSFNGTCVVVYFDDILVYRKNHKVHLEYIQAVLETLINLKFFLNLKKYEFITSQILFVGYIINPEGILVDTKNMPFNLGQSLNQYRKLGAYMA